MPEQLGSNVGNDVGGQIAGQIISRPRETHLCEIDANEQTGENNDRLQVYSPT